MYGHKIHLTVDEYINDAKYPCEINEYALAKHELIEHEVLQPFSIPDKNNIVLTRVTIAMMIDYCYRKIPFKILIDSDIIEIYRYVKEYNKQLSVYEDEVEEVANYLEQSRYFFEQLTKSMTILRKRDPALAKIINQNGLLDIFKG